LNPRTLESSNPAVRIRLYQKGDERRIVGLFKEVYGKDLTVEQWRWKYLGQGNLRVWAAVALNENDEMVAHYGGIPVRMIFRGRHITGCQCVDAMVREGYRAKEQGIAQSEGIFYRLGNLLYDTFGTFFYAFPGDVYYNWGRKAGHIVECMDVPEYRYGCSSRVTHHASRFYSLKPIEWADKRIDDLWNRVKGNLGWTMVRDRELVAWRYATNPFYKHTIYGLEFLFSKRLSGWVVVRENGDDLMVMDMVFEDSALEVLLRETIHLAFSSGKRQLRLWLPYRYKKRLLSTGFEPVDIRTWMPNFIRYKVAEPEEIRENFYYTMGDTDFL